MGKTTDIEWCDSTHNLQMGCDGCELWNPKAGVLHCYAGTLHERWAGKNKGWPDAFDKPKLFLHRLDEMLRWSDLTGKSRPEKPWLDGLPRMIFLNDLGDTFTESLPLDWLAPILPKLSESPHQFMVLTKRGHRLRQFSEQHPLPLNVWPGVSVTSDANIGRINDLLAVRGGGPKWISAEPLLSRIGLDSHGRGWLGSWDCRISLVIVGGESGPNARECNLAWVREIVSQCGNAGVPAFVKQLGANVIYDGFQDAGDWWPRQSGQFPVEDGLFRKCLVDRKGGNPSEWQPSLRVRQFPKIESAVTA